MNIFITGIAGFLGSHLADTFLREGHKVLGIDNLIGGYVDNVPEKAQFWRCDCNNRDFLQHIFKVEKVDVVYHCAATAYEGLSVFSPHLVTNNIVSASVAVFAAAAEAKVKRVVHCSSMARYGAGHVPFREEDHCDPQDPYGIGKVCAEEMLWNISETHGFEAVVAVPHNIIGPRQKYDDPYRNVASIMINRALQSKPIIVYGDGEQRRCFSYIDDCLQCLTKMATQENVVGEVINIGPDEDPITVHQLAYLVCKLVRNETVEIQFMPGRPQEVKYAFCSSDKARALLGYETKSTLEDGLRNMIEWIRTRGVKPFDYHLPLEIVNELTPKTWTEKLF